MLGSVSIHVHMRFSVSYSGGTLCRMPWLVICVEAGVLYVCMCVWEMEFLRFSLARW